MTKMTYVYILRVEHHEDMVFRTYRAAHDEAKRQAQEMYDTPLFEDCPKKKLDIHRNQVSVGVLDPQGYGWYYPYVGNIQRYKVL